MTGVASRATAPPVAASRAGRGFERAGASASSDIRGGLPPQDGPAGLEKYRSEAIFPEYFFAIATKGVGRFMSWENSGSLRSRSPGAPTVTTQSKGFLHTLESGNPEAARARLSDVFPAETEDWIPAFAGMTKYCGRVIVFFCADSSASPPLFARGVQFLHTLFRGNDEVLSVDYCLSLRRLFGGPAVICESLPISSHALSRE